MRVLPIKTWWTRIIFKRNEYICCEDTNNYIIYMCIYILIMNPEDGSFSHPPQSKSYTDPHIQYFIYSYLFFFWRGPLNFFVLKSKNKWINMCFLFICIYIYTDFFSCGFPIVLTILKEVCIYLHYYMWVRGFNKYRRK